MESQSLCADLSFAWYDIPGCLSSKGSGSTLYQASVSRSTSSAILSVRPGKTANLSQLIVVKKTKRMASSGRPGTCLVSMSRTSALVPPSWVRCSQRSKRDVNCATESIAGMTKAHYMMKPVDQNYQEAEWANNGQSPEAFSWFLCCQAWWLVCVLLIFKFDLFVWTAGIIPIAPMLGHAVRLVNCTHELTNDPSTNTQINK